MTGEITAERWVQAYKAGRFDPGEPWEDGFRDRCLHVMEEAGYAGGFSEPSAIPGRLRRIAGVIKCAIRSNPGMAWYDVDIVQGMDMAGRIKDIVQLARIVGGVEQGWRITLPCTATDNLYEVCRYRRKVGVLESETDDPARIPTIRGLGKWLSTEVTV